MTEFIPIFLYFLAVLGFAGFSLLAPHLVAPRKKTIVKDMPYESGMDPIGDARKPLDIRFYLIAILFLIFAAFWLSSRNRRRDPQGADDKGAEKSNDQHGEKANSIISISLGNELSEAWTAVKPSSTSLIEYASPSSPIDVG